MLVFQFSYNNLSNLAKEKKNKFIILIRAIGLHCQNKQSQEYGQNGRHLCAIRPCRAM